MAGQVREDPGALRVMIDAYLRAEGEERELAGKYLADYLLVRAPGVLKVWEAGREVEDKAEFFDVIVTAGRRHKGFVVGEPFASAVGSTDNPMMRLHEALEELETAGLGQALAREEVGPEV